MGTFVKFALTQMTTNVGGYWVYTPSGASANSSCIIALHGLGEQGSGSATDLDKLTTQGLAKLVNDRMGTGLEFPHDALLIFPQYTGGTPSLFRVNGIINYVKANFTFDQNKLHLTGYSLGAAGVTGWFEIGDLSAVASCSVVATPSTYYEAGAANAVAYNMPTIFIHGDQDVHPTAYAYSVNWVNELNADGINPAAVLTTLVGAGHNIDETVYDWTSYEVVSGKDFFEWHDQFSRGSGTIQGTVSGTATATGSLTTNSTTSSGVVSGTATVTGSANAVVTVSGTSSGQATTEGQRTYVNLGAATASLGGNTWIGLSDAQVTGGVFTDVMAIWGVDQTILNVGTYPQEIYKSCRLTSAGFTVQYPVSNGTYTLRLHFCEFWRNVPARNVFNVSVEGSQVITGLDVWTAAGGRYRAYTQDVPVTVSDASLTIACIPTAGDAMLNAFELIGQGASVTILTGLSGSISSTSSVTGDASTFGSTVEVISGTSSVTGNAVVISTVSGQADSTATVSASAMITTKAGGSVEGSTTTSATAKTIALASGSTSGLASLSVTESGTTKMTGVTGGASTTTASAVSLLMLSGSISGTSSAQAGTLTFAGVVRNGRVVTAVNKNGAVRATMNYTTNIT